MTATYDAIFGAVLERLRAMDPTNGYHFTYTVEEAGQTGITGPDEEHGDYPLIVVSDQLDNVRKLTHCGRQDRRLSIDITFANRFDPTVHEGTERQVVRHMFDDLIKAVELDTQWGGLALGTEYGEPEPIEADTECGFGLLLFIDYQEVS